MNVSEAVMKFLQIIKVKDIFLLSGGGIMYLLDALGKCKEINYVCNYHEQASAIAADGYSRINGYGVCFATFGPGASNALSGVIGAWYDSIPLMVISGQVRSNLIADYTKVRQIGPQEGNILEMVKPITKYAVSIRDPNLILYELEKAYQISKSGRPGPVWIEIPLDMQAAEVDYDSLERFLSDEVYKPPNLFSEIDQILTALDNSRRPILILGNGIRLAGVCSEISDLVEKLKIPVLVPYTGKDLIEGDSKYAFGVFGTAGQRHSNLILQNSDLIIGLGVGFCIAKTGFETLKFAPNAKKIFLDIDKGQLECHPLKADIQIHADLRDFLPQILPRLESFKSEYAKWMDLCLYWRDRYPVVPKKLEGSFINSYVFMDQLSKKLKGSEVIVSGNGLDCVSFYQAFNIKKGQRSILNGNWGSMGWDLPTAVGASYASKKSVICITGDGGIMLNIQELLVIGSNNLDIKIFIFNNEGYGSIKATQENLFESRYVGANRESGVANPNFSYLSKAFGIPYLQISDYSQLSDGIECALKENGPMLCEVMISPQQWIEPKATTFKNSSGKLESKPLDDMYPFLPEEEVLENREMAKKI